MKFSYGLAKSIIVWEKESSTAVATSDTESSSIDVAGINDPNSPKANYKNFMMFMCDAVPSEGHTAQSVVTKFPMSNGFIVSDHMIKQNRILKLRILVSNMVNNTLWEASLAGGISATADVLGLPILGLIGEAAALVQTSFESEDRVQSAFRMFNQFMAEGTRLYVNTILGPYSNCVVTGIETIQDKDTATVMAAEIILEELQVTSVSKQDIAVSTVLANDTDYSKFIKMGMSIGLFASGRLISKVL